MQDVYGQLVAISTIVAVTVAAIALIVRMVSRQPASCGRGNQLAQADCRHMDCAQYAGILS